jgi:hypothetical protein
MFKYSGKVFLLVTYMFSEIPRILSRCVDLGSKHVCNLLQRLQKPDEQEKKIRTLKI